MDGALLIDYLQKSPSIASRRIMRENEFFECDWCGVVCQMPIEQYKTYSEEQILNAKYRCKGCAKKTMSQSKTAYITKEQILKLQSEGMKNRAIAKHFDLSEPTFYELLKRLGITKPREKTDKPAPVNTDTKKDSVLIQNQSTDISNMVDKPAHYTAGGIECIEAIMAAVHGLTPQEAVCVANVLKYTWRFKKKNGKQDLQKAGWYLNRLLDMQGD